MPRRSLSLVIVLFSFPVIGIFIYLFGAQFAHYTYRVIALYPVQIISMISITLLSLFLVYKRESRSAFYIMVIGVIAILLSFFYTSYSKDSVYYDSVSVQEAVNENISYQDRTPFDVAVSVSNRALGDTTGDSTGLIKSLPGSGDHGQYSTSIIRRGMFQGYESAQMMDLPLYGTAGNQNVKFCNYHDDATLRFGGIAPKNNLWRAIAWRTPLDVMSNRSDAFVICDGDTPMLYAPLTEVKGFIAPVSVPYGVAVYNGTTGELTVEKNMETDIPVYPQSIATKQRKSTSASGSFTDYLFSRAGFEDTSVDENDPNGENRADFGLAKDDKSYYVSPLTPRGESSSIVALGDIQSDTLTGGNLNDYVVHTYPSGQYRQANSSIANRITGEILDGYRAQGLTVFEIVPAHNGEWVASIGNEQNVRYRAIISPDGNISLIDDSGNNIAGDEEKSTEITTDKNIQDMSTDELREMMNSILDEIVRRSETEG